MKITLSEVFGEASRAIGFMHHVHSGQDQAFAVTPKAASWAHEITLTEPLRVVDSGVNGIWLNEVPAGKTFSIRTAIAAASKVAKAGALILPVSAAPEAVPNKAGFEAWYNRPASLQIVHGASFSEVGDEDDVAVSSLPILSAPIDLGGDEVFTSHALAFSITRKQRSAVSAELLDYQVYVAIARGLANLADRLLLAAISAATPTAFTLAKAAAHGLTFDELRALVGTAGAGAAVGADGVLRAAGVVADLTAEIAGSFIGAYGRAGVAIHDDIRLIAKRLNANGDLNLTVYVGAQAVLPDPAAFWTAA